MADPLRVAVLISGGGSNMVRLVETLADIPDAQAALVLSNDPAAGGLDKARALGVTAQAIPHRGLSRRDFEDKLDARLRAAGIDLVCLAGFMRILTPEFVAGWEGRMLNIHPSLLPKYPGLHTHARALEAGDTEAGCTVHDVTAALDAGPIRGQARVPILPGDTPDTLAARVLTMEHRLYPAVLRRYVNGDTAPVWLP